MGGHGTLDFERDVGTVVVVGAGSPAAAEDRRAPLAVTLRSVLEHTPSASPIVIVAAAHDLGGVADKLADITEGRRILAVTCEDDASGARATNLAAEICEPSDVAVVVAGVTVAANWLGCLEYAALSDSIIASASPLSCGYGGISVAVSGSEDRAATREENDPSETHLSPRSGQRTSHTEDSAAVSTPLLPRIATMGPGCVYIRRSALELLGPLDEGLPLADALADFAMRAIRVGMVHVAADGVAVTGPRVVSEPASSIASDEVQDETDVRRTFTDDEQGRLRRAIRRAQARRQGLSVTIDARALTSTIGGTQTYIYELVLALARVKGLRLRALVAPDLSESARRVLESVPEIELLAYEQAIAGADLSHVVHRPQPAFTPDDLTLLRLLGERVIIGQLDLIAYHNYAYHRDVEQWRAYRRTTRLALGGADQVIFFSEHARRDALAEDLLPIARTHLVRVGADALGTEDASPAPPDGLTSESVFLLCLGTDYAHKNRPFAIQLAAALRKRGWPGRLVLAGAHTPFGSSRERERELLRENPALSSLVLDLGPVDEAHKQWLLRNARALVYPTLYEGFGLMPLEAARAGIPCLFAAQASLSEVAADAATLIPWDASASAEAVLPLLDDGTERNAHISGLQSLGIPTWDEVAEQLVAVYNRALASPPAEAAPRAWQELDRESLLVRLDRDARHLKAVAEEYQAAYRDLSDRVATGLPLIDRGGLLSQNQQRGLMRVAARRGVRAVMLAPLSLLGRLRLRGHGARTGVRGSGHQHSR